MAAAVRRNATLGRLRRRRQRGAAAVFAAVALVSGLAATFLAIDLGRLYFTQRDLQRTANMAALDAARVASGCLGIPDNATEAAYTETVRSVIVNGGEASYVGPGGALIGRRLKGADGLRYFDPIQDAGEKNRAVQVTLTRPAPGRLFPLARTRPRTLTAVAAAYSRPQATVSVGSQLAELNPDLLNDLLGAMLGGPVDITLAGYQALFAASVPLAAVLGELNLGSPEQLAETPVPPPQLLDALSDVLADQGDTTAAAAAQALADAADEPGAVTPDELAPVEDPARGVLVNAGQLALATAQSANAEIANGTNLISVPVDLPAGEGDVDIRLIEAARQATLSPGEAATAGSDRFARNAQALLQTTLPVNVPGLGRMELRMWMQSAQATAQVTDIRCARRGLPNDRVMIGARTSILRLGIGEFDDINLPNPEPRPAELLTLDVGLPLGGSVPVKVLGYAYANVGRAQNVDMEPFIGPFPRTHTLGTPPAEVIAEGLLEMGDTLSLSIELPAGLSPLQAAAVTAAAQPLLDALEPALMQALAATGSDVLLDLSSALGLQLGGADVTVVGVVADEPVLFTR